MSRKRKSSQQRPEYQISIPERNEIKSFLQDCKAPRNLKHIAEALRVETAAGQDALDKRLKAMLRDGEIIKNRRDGYGLIDKMDLIAGRVIGHHEGYGFLRPDSGDEDIFLPAREMRSLLHGDRAIVRLDGQDRRGRTTGALVEVLDRVMRDGAGRVQFHYVIIDYLARWVAGEPRAGSDAAAVRWLHREEWATLPLTEGLGPVLLRALALAGQTR